MLDELKLAQPGQTIWDRGEKSSLRGLHLRVAEDGTKSFYLYYRTRTGQQRKPKIGELGEITLSEARKRARFLLDRVAIGEDPKAQWDTKKAEPALRDVYAMMWSTEKDERGQVKGYWSRDRFEKSGWGRQVKWSWTKYVEPTFGKAKLSDITPSFVRNWHASLGAHSIYNANQAIKVLSRIFNYAEEQEIRPQHSNPCNLVKQFPEKKRERHASEEEIRTILPILERYKGKHFAGVAFLKTLIFAGPRPRFLERAEWPDLKIFTLEGQTYGVLSRSGKTSAETGDDERVVIPPQAMADILQLPRVEGMTIFGIKMPAKLWRKIKAEAGCPDLWARDWRRTFATVGMTGGMSMWTIGELLNHHSTETTKIYAKVMQGRRVEAVTTIADKIESLTKEKTG